MCLDVCPYEYIFICIQQYPNILLTSMKNPEKKNLEKLVECEFLNWTTNYYLISAEVAQPIIRSLEVENQGEII